MGRDKNVNILADDRERGAGVIDALKAIEGVVLRVERLGAGDYHVGDNLIIERKTIRDFALSVVQGRFFSQAGRLASSRRRGVIILEGTGSELKNTSVKRAALQGALINAGVVMGLAILRSLDPQETARILVYAGRQVERSISGGIYRHGRRPRGKRQRQMYILQGLPGVGPVRAKVLLDYFGNLQGIVKASAEDLTALPGIGAQTAEDIRFMLSEPPAEYQTE